MSARRASTARAGRGDRADRRAAGERGAALVELVIILPVFLLLVFGSLTGALAYEHKSEIVQAVRDGSRFGATTPLEQCDNVADCGGRNWAQLVQHLTAQRSDGSLSSSQICVALVFGPSGNVYTRSGGVYTTGTTSTFPNDGCFADGNADPGMRVHVSAVRDGDRINLVFGSIPVTLSSTATSHYEQ